MNQPCQIIKLILRKFLPAISAVLLSTGITYAQDRIASGSDSIRLNQIGFYPKGPKIAIVLTDHSGDFTIQTTNRKAIFKGKLKLSPMPDLSGQKVYLADFTAVEKPGNYRLVVPAKGYSYNFVISPNVHQQVAAGSIKAFYHLRASTDQPEKYSGKWTRAGGHPDTSVMIHPSAATDKRKSGTLISSSRGWYDAGDYNKYIVNSGITTGTLLSLYEDFPSYMKTVNLNIPESSNPVPDLLDESLWNLRWMLTMQDPDDGGVYHKLTNAGFDGMIMPDQAKSQRYVVQKGTAATLVFAAVMAQASRIYKAYESQYPGLADSCIKASVKAWKWATVNPDSVYNQRLLNENFSPKVTTGAYGDQQFDDEFTWAAAELYITNKDDSYLKSKYLNGTIKMSVPSWAQVRMLGYYSLIRNRSNLTATGKNKIPELSKKLIAFADSLATPETMTAYQTVMGRSAKDFTWGSSSVAANQGIALLQAYLLTSKRSYFNAALSNLDYLLGRNGTSYSLVTGFGQKSVMHPHHRPSVADGIKEPVPGFLSGGPNPGGQDKVPVPSKVPNQAFVDDDGAYAVNEIAINWNSPFAYLTNALEALQSKSGYSSNK